MELQSNSKPDTEGNTEWMQWKSSPWFVDIKRDTDKLWVEGISLLIKVELSLDLPNVDQNDINVLTAQLETTNIEEPNENFKSDNDSNQLYPKLSKHLKKDEKRST